VTFYCQLIIYVFLFCYVASISFLLVVLGLRAKIYVFYIICVIYTIIKHKYKFITQP